MENPENHVYVTITSTLVEIRASRTRRSGHDLLHERLGWQLLTLIKHNFVALRNLKYDFFEFQVLSRCLFHNNFTTKIKLIFILLIFDLNCSFGKKYFIF